MKTIKVTRKEILKAIRTEPLKAGTWIHDRKVTLDNGSGISLQTSVADKKCKVCAVGAVLRQKGIPDDKIFWAADSLFCDTGSSECDSDASDEGNPLQNVKDGHYMAALSSKFEQLSKRLGSGKRTRETLIRFVKRHFPKQVTVKFYVNEEQ